MRDYRHNFGCLALVGVLIFTVVLHGCKKKISQPSFDVPALLGKNIDGVQAALNLPAVVSTWKYQPIAATGEELRTFKKGEWYVVVTYRPENGRVLSFTLGTDEDNGLLKEKERFTRAGTLRKDDPLYGLDFQEAPDTVFAFTGLRIIPKPISHKILFRATGTQDVFYLKYSLQPEAGQTTTKSFIAVLPWEEEFTASTGAKLTLEATPSSNAETRKSTDPLQATVEILIDGKVAQKGKLEGLWAQCGAEIEY